MKRKLLLITALFASAHSYAQYIDDNHVGPVKLADVAEEYYRSERHENGEAEEHAKDGIKEEDKDYHFGRWYWYWKSHTDQNGYLVSPLKTFTEWQKYNAGGAMAKTTVADMSNWQFQGPTSSDGGYRGIGRINNIEFHPTLAGTYWVCTAGGGLWQTTNDGVSWTCLTDKLPVLGTSDLEVNPLNPNTMYLCTGDRDASDSYSIGVLKSTDGGVTWNATGLTWSTSQTRLTNSLVLNKIDTNSLTLATSNGIYKSYNGGTTWAQVQTGNFKQVLQHPTDTTILYAANTGSNSANIYRSKNGGATWATVTLAGGTTNKNRITLAVTPQNVAIVKAIVATNNGGLEGIYSSTDTGKTFTKTYGPTGCNGDLLVGTNSNSLTTCGNQGWYDLSIAIDPTNSNKIFVGGVNTRYSTNGGTSWSIVTQWYAQAAGVAEVHADKHWLTFHPLVPGRMFECNDGGVYKTDNPAPTSLWVDLTNGMGITQFYRNAVADTADYQLGGAQDNGTKMNQLGVWSDPSGGDGMNCEIDYADPGTYYTAYQNGDLNRFSLTLGDDDISSNIPGNPSGAWITPYIISPHNHFDLLAGYRHIYYSTDAGTSWISITGKNLTTNNLERLAMAPSNDSTIYAVADNNSKKVFYTHAFVGGQVDFDSITCPNAGANITDILVDAKDNKHFYITLGGYNSDQIVEYTFSTNTWKKMNTNLPNVPVHCINIDTSTNIMYVGTDLGVFYLDTVNKQWATFNKNLPSIEVTDLGINYKKKEIWASTYGRGLWKSIKQSYVAEDTTTDTTNIVAIVPYAPDNVVVMPNPSEGRFSVKATNEKLYGRQVKLVMLDATGKQAWIDEQVFSGSGLLHVNAQDVAKGIYLLTITDDAGIISRKRVVVR
ncbi:T9SS type A sorting domain-containing protein [Polluticoccus soli]|uniref:T9SS type A sorting domain-containing protein n=1 Tax=Polluticoccus soli TaxID=3034150 RepID=UPI0023E1C395|nr:T9SS type A sorting domain-containing protein [Flavipsychrobacter sp. JY13-12]